MILISNDFWHKIKIYNFYPFNAFLAIAMNIPQRLKTGFAVQDHNLHLDGCPVPSSKVKNLGVVLNSKLSFENHICHDTKTEFFHLRNISKLRNMLSVSDAEKLVSASSINKLQIAPNPYQVKKI